MGFKNVDWRKGHPDEGWDIEAECPVYHPGGERREIWYIQCKRYSLRSGVPPTKIDTKRIEMLSKKPDCLLLITNSHFLPKAKDWARSEHPFRVGLWEGEKLEALICRDTILIERYFPELLIQSKDNFFHSLTHLLRGSLMSLYGAFDYAQSISHQKSTALNEMQTAFSDIGAAIEQVTRQVDRFEYIIELDSPYFIRAQRQMNLKTILSECIQAFDSSAKIRHTPIDFSCPNNVPIQADTNTIKVAFQELIENAINYSFSGHPIKVDCIVNQIDGNVTTIITNLGIGIHPDEQLKVFEKYYRGKSRDVRRFVPGLGVGLALSRSIIEGHQGTITIESIQETSHVVSDRSFHKTTVNIVLPLLT